MWDRIKAFWAQPFSADMPVVGWFLFFGLVICITILWRIILGHILHGIED